MKQSAGGSGLETLACSTVSNYLVVPRYVGGSGHTDFYGRDVVSIYDHDKFWPK